jgi:raffinose/stachyose/melibiose transport system substrate-binding protein
LNLKEPKTWTECLAFLDAIKDDGKMEPILYGGADKWPLNMIFIGIEAGVLRPIKPDFWTDLKADKEKLDDPLVVECFSKMQKLGEYFQKNALGEAYDNIPGMFNQQKGAVLIDGSWRAGPFDTDLKPEFEIGVFILPSSDTAANNKFFTVQPAYGLSVYPSGNVDRIDASTKFLEFVFRPANYQKLIDATGFTPAEPEMVSKGTVAQAIAKLAGQLEVVTQWENLQIPGAKYTATDLNNELLNGNITPEEAAGQFQQSFIESKPDWK